LDRVSLAHLIGFLNKLLRQKIQQALLQDVSRLVNIEINVSSQQGNDVLPEARIRHPFIKGMNKIAPFWYGPFLA
jgi:hypothetical protein